MNFKQQTGRTIEDSFIEFDKKNPHVYQMFRDMTFRVIEKGVKKASAKTILGVIRWHFNFEVVTHTEFKINDAYTAYYARKFIRKHEEYGYIFNLKRLRS